MAINPETILEHAVSGIIGIDAHGHIQHVNSLARKLLDCEIAIGSSLETLEPDLASEVFSCIEHGTPQHNFTLQQKQYPVEVLISLIRNATDVEGAVCFLRRLEEVTSPAWMIPGFKDI